VESLNKIIAVIGIDKTTNNPYFYDECGKIKNQGE